MSDLAIGVSIGAVLSASFEHATTSAPKKLAKIGDAIALLNKKDSRFNLLQGAEANLEKSRAKLAHVSQELLKVKAAMRKADGKELEQLKSRAEQLERQQGKLSDSVERGRLKVKHAAAAHREATEAAEKHDRSIKRLGGSLEELQARETRLQRAMLARDRAQSRFSQARSRLLMPTAMLAGIGAALKGAGEFQTTLTDIGITAGLSSERMAQIGSALGELSSKTGQTRAELAEGFNVMITAGMDAGEVERVIETVGLTATAAGAEIGDVARTAFATMNNLKLAPEEMLKAMDMLVAAGKAGSFELKDMSQYFPAMTAAASKLGMTGTKAVATIGASLQVAMYGAADPSQAATNMENYLNNLTAPETVKKFQKAGINLEREFKTWQQQGLDPIEESLKLIQKVTGGDAFRIGELFGNKRVLSFITPMLANMEEYQKIRAEVAAAEGMVSDDARKRMQGDPAFAFKLMGDALIRLRDAAIAPLLAPMGDLFARIINLLAPISNWMEKNTELMRGLGKTFVSLIGGKAVFAAVAFGVAGITKAFTALRVVLLANPIGLILSGLAYAAFQVAAHWDKIGPKFETLWAGISATMTPVLDGLRTGLAPLLPLWDGLVSGLQAAWTWFKNLFAPMDTCSANFMDSVYATQAFGETLGTVLGAALTPVRGVADAVGWMVETIREHWDSIQTTLSWPLGGLMDIWDAIKGSLSGLWDGFADMMGPALDGWGDALAAWQPVWDAVVAGFSELWHWITEVVGPFESTGQAFEWLAVVGKGIGTVIGAAFQFAAAAVKLLITAVGWTVSKVIEHWDTIWAMLSWNPVSLIVNNWGAISGFFGDMWDGIKDLFSSAMTWFQALPDKFSEFGKMMMDGLIDGIKGMTGAVGNAIKGIADSTVNWFKDKLKINSPSRVFIGLGAGVGEGAVMGIGRMVRQVGHASAALGTAATLAFAPQLDMPDVSAPGLPAVAAHAASRAGQAAPAVAHHTTITINITQQPGQSAETLARQVARIIRREEGQVRRAGLWDGDGRQWS